MPNIEELFGKWWTKKAEKKISKIEKKWIKENEPNEPDSEDEGTDHWCVNEMMHSGDASEMVYDHALEAFTKGYNNKPWALTQENSTYCDLDEVITDAHEAGQNERKTLEPKRTRRSKK